MEHFAEWTNRYSRVTAEAVRGAVSRWLITPNRLAIHVTPDALQRDASPEPDRQTPPPFQAQKPYRAPEVKTAKLPNGLQILVVERHDLPKVAVDLRFRLGPALNPPGKAGLALLTMATAQKGTSSRSGSEIDRVFAGLATSIHASDDAGSQSAGLEVLRKNLDPALQLLAEVIRRPTYPEDAVESQKNDFLGEFERAVGRIDNFQVATLNIAFGPAHPLGNALGNAGSYRSIARQDLVDFQALYWKPDVAALSLAGDITLEDAVSLARKYFGDWSGTAPPAPAMPAAKPMNGRLFAIDRKGATQTLVVQILPGMPNDDPDFPALVLVDRILGGMFSSRLMENIREAKGIAYTASSQTWQFPGFGLWVGRSTVQVEKTREAIEEFRREVRGVAGEKPIAAQELETARDSFLQAYPLSLELAMDVAQGASRDWAWGLPATSFQDLPRRIAAVTLAQAQAVARKYARADRAVFLLIGDRAKFEGTLRELGLGEVVALQ